MQPTRPGTGLCHQSQWFLRSGGMRARDLRNTLETQTAYVAA